jgi:hypothetical protein
MVSAVNGRRSGLAALLSRLEGVKRTGTSTWIARCPGHDDRRPSLAIRELEAGRILIHCFAGCAVEHVLHAVGLHFDALFPDRAPSHHVAPERQPFPPTDVLRCVAFEGLVAAVGAENVANGLSLSADDRARLLLAAQRLQAAAEACHAR